MDCLPFGLRLFTESTSGNVTNPSSLGGTLCSRFTGTLWSRMPGTLYCRLFSLPRRNRRLCHPRWQLQVEQWEHQQPENSIKRMHKLVHRELTETSSSSLSNKTLALTQGIQMIREWNGNTYRVTTTNDGYEYSGQI